jgi:uncharacterized protein with PIN domain
MHYDEDMCQIPQDALDQSKLISCNLLPHTSKDRYKLEYSRCLRCSLEFRELSCSHVNTYFPH